MCVLHRTTKRLRWSQKKHKTEQIKPPDFTLQSTSKYT